MFLKIVLAMSIFLLIYSCGDDPQTGGLCDDKNCQENSYCDVLTGECICFDGYSLSGDICVSGDVVCKNDSCTQEHKTKCSVDNNKIICSCDDGFHKKGNKCVVNTNCDNVTCNSNEHCDESSGACICNTGFHLDSGNCIANGNCYNVTCGSNEHCDESNGACVCDTGFHLDGGNCIANGNCYNVTCGSNEHCDESNGACICNTGFHLDGGNCIVNDPCFGVNCNGHGDCVNNGGFPQCNCETGYVSNGAYCVSESTPCDSINCGGKGTCYVKENNDPICACNVGYSPELPDGLNCVVTSTYCKTGAINFDYNDDGIIETSFTPSDVECSMYELINFIRAVHDKEGHPESHKPLAYEVTFSAYGRYHCIKMAQQGGLFHEDFPPGWRGQNVAYNHDGSGLSHMNQYMGCNPSTNPICVSSSEPHCDSGVLSHHCNIMKTTNVHVGIGMYLDGSRSYSTQNF